MSSTRFDLFIIDANGTISHKSGNGDQWSDNWTPIPGNTKFKYDPVAVVYPPFRLNVFAVGMNNELFWRWREGPTSDWQPREWESLGGAWTSKPLAMVCHDMLYVFCLGSDRSLYAKYWDGDRWSSFSPLEGILHSHLPTAHVFPSGFCFYSVGADETIYHKWGEKHEWLPGKVWYKMTGESLFALKSTRWGKDNRLVVHIGKDSALWQKYISGGGWRPSGNGAWNRIGGDSYQGTPELVVRGDNQVTIFAVRTDGTVEHRDGVVPNYSAPVNIGGNVDNYDIVATSGDKDRMDLFIVGKDRKVHHKKWNSGQWEPSQNTYFDLGGFSHSGIAVTRTQNSWHPDENGGARIQPWAYPIQSGTYFIQSVSRPGSYLAHEKDGTVTLQQVNSPSGNNSLMWTISSGESGDHIITASGFSNAILHLDNSYQVLCSPTSLNNTNWKWNIDVRQPGTYVIGNGAFAIDLARSDLPLGSMRTTGRLEQCWKLSVCDEEVN